MKVVPVFWRFFCGDSLHVSSVASGNSEPQRSPLASLSLHLLTITDMLKSGVQPHSPQHTTCYGLHGQGTEKWDPSQSFKHRPVHEILTMWHCSCMFSFFFLLWKINNSIHIACFIFWIGTLHRGQLLWFVNGACDLVYFHYTGKFSGLSDRGMKLGDRAGE